MIKINSLKLYINSTYTNLDGSTNPPDTIIDLKNLKEVDLKQYPWIKEVLNKICDDLLLSLNRKE